MEPDQIDILAFTVLRGLEQIDNTQETRLSRQLWGDVQKTDRLNGIHFDLAFVHTVPGARGDVGASPDSDAASDFSATNSITKTLGEDHNESLRWAYGCHFDPFRRPYLPQPDYAAVSPHPLRKAWFRPRDGVDAITSSKPTCEY